MDASTPIATNRNVEPQTDGSPGDVSLPSPISVEDLNSKVGLKTYPKRERKPRTFGDPDTDISCNIHDSPPDLSSPTEVVKRGRGRPRKIVEDLSTDDDVAVEEKSKDDLNRVLPKRGRGRPPKQIQNVNEAGLGDTTHQIKVEQQDEGKQRRTVQKPKKYSDDLYISRAVNMDRSTTRSQNCSNEKRGRGRPRKYNENKSDLEVSDTGADDLESGSPREKRKRGRPKKCINALDVENNGCLDSSQGELNVKGIGRGRPRKYVDTEYNLNVTDADTENVDNRPSTGQRKRGRRRKVVGDEIDPDGKDMSGTSSFIDECRQKRKRGKPCNYYESDSAVSDDDDEHTTSSTERPKRGRLVKFVSDASDIETAEMHKEKERPKQLSDDYDLAEEVHGTSQNRVEIQVQQKMVRPNKYTESDSNSEKRGIFQNELCGNSIPRQQNKEKPNNEVDDISDADVEEIPEASLIGTSEDKVEKIPPNEKRMRRRPKKYADDTYDLDEVLLEAAPHETDGKEKRKQGRSLKFADKDHGVNVSQLSENVENNIICIKNDVDMSETVGKNEKEQPGTAKRVWKRGKKYVDLHGLDKEVTNTEENNAESQHELYYEGNQLKKRPTSSVQVDIDLNIPGTVASKSSILPESGKYAGGKGNISVVIKDDRDTKEDSKGKLHTTQCEFDGSFQRGKRKRNKPKRLIDEYDADASTNIEELASFPDNQSVEKKTKVTSKPSTSKYESGPKEKEISGSKHSSIDPTTCLENEACSEVDMEPKSVSGPVRRGHKRKKASVPEENSFKEEGDLQWIQPERKRRKRAKKIIADDDSVEQDDAEVAAEDASTNVVHRCPKCEHTERRASSMQRHVATVHQIWWTVGEPEGSVRYGALMKVLKIRRYFNCPSCNKRINHVQYYQKHAEWCGKEDQFFTCDKCGRPNLMSQWRDLHLKTCPAILREQERQRLDQIIDVQEDEKSEVTEGERGGRKRQAAKRAMAMVQNLSKNADLVGGTEDVDSGSEVNLDNEEEEEETDEDIDAEVDEEGSDEEITDEDLGASDVVVVKQKLRRPKVPVHGGHISHLRRYHFVYEKMLALQEDQWSETLFPDWLPQKLDCQLLSPSESEVYIPKRSESVRFRFGKKGTCDSLSLHESRIVKGLPVFYTGLRIWRLAWCPVPPYCEDGQFLAVVGKADQQAPYLCGRASSGPGVIQVWNTGITDNSLSQSSPGLPRLCYSVAHDYGMAFEIIWCPVGCYQRGQDKVGPEVYRRLGLLAVAFSDGTVRIFSLPHLPTLTDGESPPAYKVFPVVSLIPYRTKKKIDVACTCIDWIKTKGNCKIMAGYSDGSVRVFHLTTKSAFLWSASEQRQMLLPYQSFRPYGTIVRSLRWCFSQEDLIALASDDFDINFMNLSSPFRFKFEDGGMFQGTSLANTLWNAGVYVASDDNYAPGTNRVRYMDCASILFSQDTGIRKDEIFSFNLSAQSACIWEVSCSDWLSYVVSCDNKGGLNGMPMTYTMDHGPDTKMYMYRQILMNTSIAQGNDKEADSGITQTNEDGIEASQAKCTCSQEENKDSQNCAKCRINQSEARTRNSCGNSHSGSPIGNSNTNTSTDAKVLASSSKMSSQSEDVLQNSADKIDKDIKVEGSNEDIKKETTHICKGSPRGSKDFEVLKQSVYLQYEETFQTRNRGPVTDRENDLLDRYPIAALKSVQCNPNHLQCCWVAYGGNAGIIRFNNTYNQLHDYARHAVKKSLKHPH